VSPLRNIDIGKAAGYIAEILSEIDNDSTLNDIQIASMYLNAGVYIQKTINLIQL